MPVVTKNFNIVRGRVLRITSLDECCNLHDSEGAPACEVSVTKGLISVALAAEIEDGEEIRDRNWAGELCVVDRTPDEFIRWTVNVTFCGVEPSVVNLITGNPVELADSEVVGFRTVAGAIDTRFAMEMWSGTSPVDCGPDATPLYGYTLLPCLTGGRVGDLTIENGRADFTVEGAFTEGGGGWGVGPYDVINVAGVPSPLEVAMQTNEHHLLRTTTLGPPEVNEDCMTLEEAGGTRPGA